MAYSPVSFQLECGHFPESTSLDGHWCPECAGVTAMYKEDWEKILSGSYDNGKCLNIDRTVHGRVCEGWY